MPSPRNSLRSEDLINFWPRTEVHEEALIHRFWEVLGIDSIVLEEPSPCYQSSHLLRAKTRHDLLALGKGGLIREELLEADRWQTCWAHTSQGA